MHLIYLYLPSSAVQTVHTHVLYNNTKTGMIEHKLRVLESITFMPGCGILHGIMVFNRSGVNCIARKRRVGSNASITNPSPPASLRPAHELGSSRGQSMLDSVDWRLFLLLVAAGFAGLLSVLPLEKNFVELTTKWDKSKTKKSEYIHTKITAVGIKLLLLAIAVWGGLLLSKHLGLVVAPLIEGILNATEAPYFWNTITISILSGLSVGAIISLLMLFGTRENGPEESSPDFFSIPLWKRQLAGLFHGGIVEELLFRLFLLSFLAWSVSSVFGLQARPFINEVFWTANIVSALLFGLAHLPSSTALGGVLTKKEIALTILLNGFAGLVYGYLFWQSGIEAAMLAHMSTHVVLQPCMRWLLRVLKTAERPTNKDRS